MHLSVLSSFDEVSPACWAKLVESCPDSTIFQSYEWLSVCEKCLPRVAGSVQIVVIGEGDQLLAAAPLWTTRLSNGSVWKFIGDDYSDYQVFPVSGGSPATMASLIHHLVSIMDPGDVLQLGDVPQFSLLADILSDDKSIGEFRVTVSSVTECPAIEVANNPVGVSRATRKSSVRRSLASLSRRGPVLVSHHSDPAAISMELPAFFEQHIRRWQDTRFPSLFLQEHNREFYKLITSRLGERGAILFTKVQVNDVAVAYHYGLVSGAKLLWYKPTFDVGYARQSPGDTLVTSIIDEAVNAGRDSLDFTRGAEPFKYRFASMVALNYRFEVRRPSWNIVTHARGAIESLKNMYFASDGGGIDLGGAAIRSRSSSALLLDYDVRRHAAFALALRSFGAEIEIASLESLSRENAGKFDKIKREASETEDAQGQIDRKTRGYNRANEYGLIVAFDTRSAEILARGNLPSMEVGGGALLPSPAALDGLRERIDGLGSGLNVDPTGLEVTQQISAHLLCLYAHGRLVFRALIPRDRTTGASWEARRGIATKCNDLCKIVGWHGIAAFSLVSKDSKGFGIISVDPTASCEMPDSVARELARAIWCLTQGVHVRAKPGY